MKETSFIEALQDSPGDRDLLRRYADWLIDQGDPRGQHLNAELAVYDAEDSLRNADNHLTRYRSTQTQDFDWLNTVFPMLTKSPAPGAIYSSPEPGAPPLVEYGTFCDRSTIVGIVESQKIFYPVPAGHTGMVAEVFFQNGDFVEMGTVLLKIIRPQKPGASKRTVSE